ncbi:MAG: hypothetical protein ACOX18_06240 [Bacillota bacterium]
MAAETASNLGGQIARVVIEGTPSGLVRIVVYDVEGMEVVIAEQAADEQIILEGSFEQVTVQAANAQIETRGETAIAQMVIEETATAVTVTTSDQTTIEKAVVNGETPVFQGGKGTIKEVEGTAADTVEDLDDVVAKPEEPEEPGDDPGPGGPVIVSVKGVTVAGEAIVGATLTATPSPSAATVRYQWQRADSEDGTYENISGATSPTYTLTTDDGGKWIRVQVTGTGIYVGTRTSTPVGPVVDKSELEAKVNEALDLNEDDYTEESWAAFAAALAAAEAVLADPEATQAEVDDALAALTAAIEGLKEVEEPPVVDKSALEAKVNEARGLNKDDYTEESWAIFAAALADAEAVLADPDATQADVDAALAALVGAMDGLEEVEEPPVVDKSALEAKVNEARGLNAADYTEESWAVFAAALADAEAVLADPDATQAEVDAALAALVGAMDGLEEVEEPPVVDKSALEAKVNEARGLNAADYTEESWAVFAAALADAEAVLADPDATQAEVDAALAALVGAMDGLEEVEEPPVVDKSALEAKVNEARGLNEADYTEESWAVFAAALADAEAVLADPDATQAEVDAALAALVGAMDGLEEVEEPPVVDKSALEAKVNEALGLNEDDYTEESWAVFAAALAAAEAVLADPDATQADVDAALAALVAAMEGLEEVEEPPVVDKSALEAKVNEALGLNAADYTEESWAVFAAALADAEAVLADPDATQAEVDAALAALTAAWRKR